MPTRHCGGRSVAEDNSHCAYTAGQPVVQVDPLIAERGLALQEVEPRHLALLKESRGGAMRVQ